MNEKKRILKNTFFLYIRSLVSLFIKLYSSRLVLNGLGIEEFGVYHVVGGLVIAFSFLNGTMSAATQRFLSYEIGLGEKGNVKKVFSTTIFIHLCLGVAIIILLETLGQPFLRFKMSLGKVDISTASWILHFTALSSFFSICSVPYNSFLISKENMSIFAYIDIFTEFLKLGVALTLSLFDGNRLIYYAGMLCLVSFLNRCLYAFICKKKYSDCSISFIFDKELTKQIASFSGWTVLSAFSFMIKNHGVSIIANMFLGPIINAAIGIGNQVNIAVKTFSQNFQMSFMPQIVKNYASEDFIRMNKLIMSGAKISTYLLIAFAVPIILECNYILKIWLGSSPPCTSAIVALLLLETILQSLTCTGNTAIRATGNVKKFEITYNLIELLCLPTMLIWLIISPNYYAPFISIIIFIFSSNFVKISFLQKQIPLFKSKEYIKDLLIKTPLLTVISVIIPSFIFIFYNESLVRFILCTLTFEIFFALAIYFWGINEDEKKLLGALKNKLLKKA